MAMTSEPILGYGQKMNTEIGGSYPDFARASAPGVATARDIASQAQLFDLPPLQYDPGMDRSVTMPQMLDVYQNEMPAVHQFTHQVIQGPGGWEERVAPMQFGPMLEVVKVTKRPLHVFELAPEDAPPSLLQSSTETSRMKLHRYNLGFKLRHDYFTTGAGAAEFEADMVQLRSAAHATRKLLIAAAIATAKNEYRFRNSQRRRYRSMADATANERSLFGILNTDEKGLYTIVHHAKSVMATEGASPTICVGPDGWIVQSMFTNFETEASRRGEARANQALVAPNEAARGRFDGLDMYEAQRWSIVNYRQQNMELLLREVVLPQYFLQANGADSDAHGSDFNAQRELSVCIPTEDGSGVITPEEMEFASHRWNDDGTLRDLHKQIARDPQSKFLEVGFRLGADKLVDPFIYDNDDGTFSVISAWGEARPEFWDAEAMRSAGKRIAEGILSQMDPKARETLEEEHAAAVRAANAPGATEERASAVIGTQGQAFLDLLALYVDLPTSNATRNPLFGVGRPIRALYQQAPGKPAAIPSFVQGLKRGGAPATRLFSPRMQQLLQDDGARRRLAETFAGSEFGRSHDALYPESAGLEGLISRHGLETAEGARVVSRVLVKLHRGTGLNDAYTKAQEQEWADAALPTEQQTSTATLDFGHSGKFASVDFWANASDDVFETMRPGAHFAAAEPMQGTPAQIRAHFQRAGAHSVQSSRGFTIAAGSDSKYLLRRLQFLEQEIDWKTRICAQALCFAPVHRSVVLNLLQKNVPPPFSTHMILNRGWQLQTGSMLFSEEGAGKFSVYKSNTTWQLNNAPLQWLGHAVVTMGAHMFDSTKFMLVYDVLFRQYLGGATKTLIMDAHRAHENGHFEPTNPMGNPNLADNFVFNMGGSLRREDVAEPFSMSGKRRKAAADYRFDHPEQVFDKLRNYGPPVYYQHLWQFHRIADEGMADYSSVAAEQRSTAFNDQAYAGTQYRWNWRTGKFSDRVAGRSALARVPRECLLDVLNGGHATSKQMYLEAAC